MFWRKGKKGIDAVRDARLFSVVYLIVTVPMLIYSAMSTLGITSRFVEIYVDNVVPGLVGARELRLVAALVLAGVLAFVVTTFLIRLKKGESVK